MSAWIEAMIAAIASVFEAPGMTDVPLIAADLDDGADAVVSVSHVVPAASPVVGRGSDWFHMPVRRREPLDAQCPAVVAAGEAVRRMR